MDTQGFEDPRVMCVSQQELLDDYRQESSNAP